MNIDLDSYDKILIFVSGGADSTYCLLHVLDQGVPPSKIELHHHLIDGRDAYGNDLPVFFDWEVTPGYCEAMSRHFNIPLYYSWREGGFFGELMKEDAPSAPVAFETPEGEIQRIHGIGKCNTRLKFPAKGSLRTRWCSAYLKIDVANKMLIHQPRFETGKYLTVTGERAEESVQRAGYNVFEPERCSNSKRHIDRWRPAHGAKIQDVWALIERHRVNPHPAYKLGWGRVSCKTCIYCNADLWATIRHISPRQFNRIAQLEEQLNHTIAHKRKKGEIVTLTVNDIADAGTILPEMKQHDIKAALSRQFKEPFVLPEGEWELPVGAFADKTGPT